MAEGAESFDHLMQRVRDGCDDAARELWQRYGNYILRVVRRQLQQKASSKFDSEDLAQQVWGSFFARPEESLHFNTPDELLAFLASVARNKATDEYRRHFVLQKRNVNRETSLDGSAAWVVSTVASDDPTPSKALSQIEELERLTADRSVRTATVVDLFAAGHSTEQIARRLHLHKNTVLQVLQRVAQQARHDAHE
jgi:RNA polymerase sigma factor (sigma-70 family)